MISDSLPNHTPEPIPASGTPRPRPAPRPRWLIPAVAAVVVAAVGIGVVAGLTLTSQRAGGSAAPAAGWVPADASIYYEIRLDLPGDQRANLRTFLAHFSRLNPDQLLTDELDQQIDAHASALPSGISYTSDVKPWFDGTLAAAMIGAPSMTASSRAAADALLFAGVKDVTAASDASDRIRDAITSSGGAITSTTHAGTTIWTATAISRSGPAARQPIAWAVTPEEVIIGTSSDLVARSIDAHGGQPSLAESAQFSDAVGRLPTGRTVTVAVNTAALVGDLRQQLASAQPSAAPFVDALTSRLPAFVASSARFEGDRLALDSATLPASGAPTLTNRDRGLAAAAPADAIFFADGNDVGRSLAAFATALEAGLSSSGAVSSDQLHQLDQALGGDLGSLFSWIGDAAVVAGDTNGTPYVGLIISPTNAHDASVKLLQLQGLLELANASGSAKVSISEADHNGTRITTIHWQAGTDTPAWASELQYAVTDARVVIGSGDSLVARILDMQAGSSLAGTARFRDAVDAVGGLKNAGTYWLDLSALRAAVEPVLPSDVATTYQADVKPWVAPFDYVVGGVLAEDGGGTTGHLAIVVH